MDGDGGTSQEKAGESAVHVCEGLSPNSNFLLGKASLGRWNLSAQNHIMGFNRELEQVY